MKRTCGKKFCIITYTYAHDYYIKVFVISLSALRLPRPVELLAYKTLWPSLLDKVRSAVCCLRICLQLVPSISRSLSLSVSLSHTFDICHFCGQIENCKKSVGSSPSATWQLDILFECNGHIQIQQVTVTCCRDRRDGRHTL